jgi:Polyketide cyclase / dehydrase and lipid transport
MRALVLACVLSGCASEVGADRAPELAPAGPREARATVVADIDAPPEDVFDYVVREDTPERDLRGYGVVDGVRGSVRLTDGGWDHAGATRVVVLDGGGTLMERIELIERPRRFVYRVEAFHHFAAADFATRGRGYWTVARTPTGTRVSWTYTFTARSCPATPVLRAAMAAFFRPYMENGLRSIKAHVEGAP